MWFPKFSLCMEFSKIILQWDSLIGPTQEKFESVDTCKCRSIHSKQPIWRCQLLIGISIFASPASKLLCTKTMYRLVLGGYQIFWCPLDFILTKIDYKTFWFSLFNFPKTLYTGSGYQYFCWNFLTDSQNVNSHKFENS